MVRTRNKVYDTSANITCNVNENMETTPINTRNFTHYGRAGRRLTSPAERRNTDTTEPQHEVAQGGTFEQAKSAETGMRKETIYCDSKELLHNTPPLLIPIPHENRYITVAYRKSATCEGTWSPVRELLADHINANKRTDTKNVRFNETIKTFTYGNKDSDDEFEMHADDDFETEMNMTTTKYDRDDATRTNTKYKTTYDRDETYWDKTKSETNLETTEENLLLIMYVNIYSSYTWGGGC